MNSSFFRKIAYSVKRRTASTLPDKMFTDNIIQLFGRDHQAVVIAVENLKKGQIIAVPTDTVYGLAVDSTNSSALASLYELKGRDINKPLAICVSCVSEVKKWGVTEELPKGLLRRLLPGPVTVLLKRKERLNPELNPGEKKVGIRVPGDTWHPFVQFVSATLGKPLALTSANRSNEPNSIHVEEFKCLWPKISVIFDASVHRLDHEYNKSREGSTIVDLSESGKFKIVRPGVAYDQTVQTLNKYKLENIS